MNIKNSQKGFGILGVVFTIVAIGLIGAVGWFVYDRQMSRADRDSALNTVTKTEEIPANPLESSENADYLVIKEWGVKVPLSEITEGAEYTYKNGGVYLNVNIQGDTSKSCQEQAAISRVTEYSESADNWRERPSELDKMATKIGNIYYLIEGSQSICSEIEAVQTKVSAIRSEWLKQGKNITPAE